MNSKLFGAIAIFVLLFGILSLLEDSAFADTKYKKKLPKTIGAKTTTPKAKLKTPEKPQTTVRDLTGNWEGTAKWTGNYDFYPEPVSCSYTGTFSLSLQQNQNVVTGNVVATNVKASGSKECNGDVTPSGAVSANVFGSGFSGTISGLLTVDGQFTTDLIRGKFSGVYGTINMQGDFTASRTS